MQFKPEDPVVTLNCLCTTHDRAAVIADGQSWWTERTAGDPPHEQNELVEVACAPFGETDPTHYLCCTEVDWPFVRQIRQGAIERGTPVTLEVDFYSEFMDARGIRVLDEDTHAYYLRMEKRIRDNLYRRRRGARLERARNAVRR